MTSGEIVIVVAVAVIGLLIGWLAGKGGERQPVLPSNDENEERPPIIVSNGLESVLAPHLRLALNDRESKDDDCDGKPKKWRNRGAFERDTKNPQVFLQKHTGNPGNPIRLVIKVRRGGLARGKHVMPDESPLKVTVKTAAGAEITVNFTPMRGKDLSITGLSDADVIENRTGITLGGARIVRLAGDQINADGEVDPFGYDVSGSKKIEIEIRSRSKPREAAQS